jgi:ABC-type dipeptide/oligopeptide/nickel transport system ATPase component
MVMKSGRVVEYGNATTVLENPSSDYTRSLLDSVPGNSH